MAYRPPGARKAEAKESKAESEESKDDPLLLRVARYFKGEAFLAAKDEGLEVVYEEFVLNNAEVFLDADENVGDHKFEYTELHNSYLRLFEKTCSWVVEVNGGTDAQFQHECQSALDGNIPSAMKADETYQWFIDALLAALDYNVFFKTMCKAAQKRKK